jgi:flavorubredoxin
MARSRKTVEIAPKIHWVGVEDWHRRLFDSLIPLPYGTSYNCYLVVGRSKTVLVDTVQGNFADELVAKITTVVEPEKIDYVVMNHAEPDHAGSIPRMMAVAPSARLVLTAKGAPVARKFYGVQDARMMVVKEGDSIDLGGKTLRFLEAPWVHWPETMFTFAVEDKVLFPCDFFGSHIASDVLYEDEVGDMLLPSAKGYFADIMGPLMTMAGRALDKAKSLQPDIIAPSHGPVHRNPQKIMGAYEKWIKGPLEKKAVVVYVSMWGSTERLAETVTAAISAEGVTAVPYNLVNADVSHVAADLLDCSAIVIGAPTVLGNPHPLGSFGLILVKYLRPRAKLAAIFSSCGWGGGAVNLIKSQLDNLGLETVGTLEIQGPPTEEEINKAIDLGKKIASRVISG